MTTPLFLLRCLEIGVSIRDLDLLTIRHGHRYVDGAG